MQPVVASLQFALLFAVQVHGGVYAPSLPNQKPAENVGIMIFHAVGTQHDKMQGSSCKDDPTWVDEDGDGCAAYASAIMDGHLSREVACGFQLPGVEDPIESGDPKGAARHCRATCGTCLAEPEMDTVHPIWNDGEHSCEDDSTWTDEDGDGCDVYAMHISEGSITQAMACGFESVDHLFLSGNPKGAAEHCRATCGTCAAGLQTPMNSKNKESLISESKETRCMDDQSWVDMDGDGCAVYAKAIASGHIEQEQACGRAHADLLSGNPSEAAKYCPVTCGNCPIEGYGESDGDMKDLIKYLVHVESELILESASASIEEPELVDVPAATTTTTTGAKKLPEVELSSNATWAVYSVPEEEEDSMELSRMDLLKMVAMPQQSGFKRLV